METILSTRRQFIRKGLASLVGSIPIVNGLESALNAEPAQVSSRITFEEALADRENKKGLRQKYLEQLVRSSPYSQYFSKVVYDHDRSLALKSNTDLGRILNNPQILEEVLHSYLFLTDVSYIRLDSNAKAHKRKGFLDSKENKDAFIKRLINEKNEMEKFVRTHGAFAMPDGGFGLGAKSTVYVLSSLFEEKHIEFDLGYSKMPVTIRPTEARLQSIIVHEGIHAKDDYEGIPGIRRTDYLNIHPKVASFVKELRGHLGEINAANELELPNKDHMASMNFNLLPPAYLSAVYSIVNYFIENEAVIAPRNISFGDSRHIISQLNDLMKWAPEILAQPTVRNYFKNFGLLK
ncbi:hypothetical protein HYS31_08270 [Candidatus Woesearchaeota archaeon]|nr:hypothetical protein [Candidatus Woesearchaeota archaeon]